MAMLNNQRVPMSFDQHQTIPPRNWWYSDLFSVPPSKIGGLLSELQKLWVG